MYSSLIVYSHRCSDELCSESSVGHSRESRQLAVASSEAQAGKEYVVSFVLFQLLHLDRVWDAVSTFKQLVIGHAIGR